ncbi:uncharacterized protein EV420DRAFT_1745927 [Desarmillaria tabescens]|uniref:Uncharacterized protein n=1 Tax=Armillaria tabescens TaxID=1929756 RepID=A0AA39NBF4_ARMTA|nr:uncharacterized protein EV420DRAFT_1745927 [Desarmillaria tabescens]KAK0462550.1 hypothetical protein EV420DRAFT_1745927 [Desarmillaria tabescens]
MALEPTRATGQLVSTMSATFHHHPAILLRHCARQPQPAPSRTADFLLRITSHEANQVRPVPVQRANMRSATFTRRRLPYLHHTVNQGVILFNRSDAPLLIDSRHITVTEGEFEATAAFPTHQRAAAPPQRHRADSLNVCDLVYCEARTQPPAASL